MAGETSIVDFTTESNRASVSSFHNSDQQVPNAAGAALLTGGVAQTLSPSGLMNRQRQAGLDGISALGIVTSSQQFAMAFLTTDSTDNFAAGTRTFTPVNMSGTIQGVAWSIQAGSVLQLDSGGNQETVEVTAVTATTFTCVTTKAHNGTVTPFNIAGFVFNNERDAAGELDGATGSGTAIAAEYEYNGGAPGNSNYDRARNLFGKAINNVNGTVATKVGGAALAGGETTIQLGSATGLNPGSYIFLSNAGGLSGGYEAVRVASNYTGGTTVPLSSAVVGASRTLAFFSVYNAQGPGANPILPDGIGLEEEVLFNSRLGTFELDLSSNSNPTSAYGIPCVATGLAPLTSFTNQSASGTNGTAIDNGVARSQHSLFVVSGAGVSAGVVTLQGSNDNVNWFNTACTVTTNAATSAFANNLANFPFRYIRASITTVITGGTVTATIASA